MSTIQKLSVRALGPWQVHALRTDEKLVSLMMPLQAGTARASEPKMLQAIQSEVVVWAGQNIVLAGPACCQTCLRKSMPLQVQEVELASHVEAERWVIRDQLARSGLTRQGACYLRGRRYRLELQASGSLSEDYQDPKAFFRPAVASPALGKVDRKWQIGDRLASEYRTGRKAMREAFWFAVAVDNIVAACRPECPVSGGRARQLLLGDSSCLPAKAILQISRMAPPRQRYALEQANQGRRPLAKPPANLHVFDTAHFGEVLSRLRRAGGSLAKAVRFLAQANERRCGPLVARGVLLLLHVEQINEEVPRLRRCIEQMTVREATPAERKEPPSKAPGQERRGHPYWRVDTWRTLHTGIPAACSWIIKIVHDFADPPQHEMVHMAATALEKEASLSWLDLVERSARQLRPLLADNK